MLRSLISLYFISTYLNFQVFSKDINIAVLVPRTDIDHGCTKAAIELAIDDIHEENFLSKVDVNGVTAGYFYKPIYGEVGSDDATALDFLYKAYHNNQSKIIVATIGPPHIDQNNLCDDFTTEYATNIMSYSIANEPVNLFFGAPTPPSIISSFYAGEALLKHFGWSKIALVYDYSNKRYVGSTEKLRVILRSSFVNDTHVEILADQGIWSEPASYQVTREVDAVQNAGARMIFALVSVLGARKLFCEAYERGLYAPKVVWMLFEVLPRDWASEKYNSLYNEERNAVEREIKCSEEQLLQAAFRHIVITNQNLRRDDVRTRSGMTSDQFRDRVHDKVGVVCHDEVGYAYDAVWTLALGHEKYIQNEPTPFFVSFLPPYYWYPMSYGVIEAIRILEFEGLTGPITFDLQFADKPYRIGQIAFWSNKNKGNLEYIGLHDTKTDNLTFVNEYQTVLFKQGLVPKDTASYVKVYQEFTKPLFIIIWIMAMLGIVFSTCCLIVTLSNSRDSRIQFSSPIVYSITVIGSYLCFLSIIVYSFDTRFVNKDDIPKVCWGFLIILSIGFTLTFGSLFSKAWESYKMYLTPSEGKAKTHELKEKKHERFSIIMIFCFVVIDIIIFALWRYFSNFDYTVQTITEDTNRLQDVIEIQQFIGCTCKHRNEFTVAIYCYKGAMLIFGLFIAWQSRNSKECIENETKQIAMAIYNVVAISIIGVVCSTVLANTTQQQALYAIVGVCVCLCTYATLLLMFVPQIRLALNFNNFAVASDKTSVNEETYRDTISHGEKKITTGGKMMPAISTGTLSTQISSDNAHESQVNHTESVFGIESLSIASTLPSYLESSMSSINLPFYLSNNSSSYNEKRVDSFGRLDSGVYVGDIEEEEE